VTYNLTPVPNGSMRIFLVRNTFNGLPLKKELKTHENVLNLSGIKAGNPLV